MARTLITGGAGFIGLHLARHLVESGDTVVLVDDFSRGVADAALQELTDRSGADLIRCDLTEPDALMGLGTDFDRIVHLAAVIGVDIVRSRPFDVLSLNHRMLEAVLNFAKGQKALQRFLFSSTSEVYGGTLRYFGMPVPTPETTPLTVDDPLEPRTTYMLSKIHGEFMVRHSGLPYTIFRVHNAYGPRMGLSHVIPQLLAKAYRLAPGEPLPVYSVEHRRSFCFVSDVVAMISRIAQTPACANETLNVGTEGPEISMGELARIVLDTVGSTAEITALPETPGSPRRRAPDTSRLLALTGYAPNIGLEDGVARTFRWYKEHIFNGHETSAV